MPYTIHPPPPPTPITIFLREGRTLQKVDESISFVAEGRKESSSLIQSQPTNWTNLFPLLGWKEEGNHPSYTNNNQLDESISFVARGGKRAYPRSSLIQYQPTNWTNLFPLLGCTVANILALLRNIDLEPQTQSM